MRQSLKITQLQHWPQCGHTGCCCRRCWRWRWRRRSWRSVAWWRQWDPKETLKLWTIFKIGLVICNKLNPQARTGSLFLNARIIWSLQLHTSYYKTTSTYPMYGLQVFEYKSFSSPWVSQSLSVKVKMKSLSALNVTPLVTTSDKRLMFIGMIPVLSLINS